MLLAVATGLLGAVAGRYFKAQRHYQAACRALDRCDYDRARDHLALCLAAWPASGEKHLLAARVARRSGAFDDAQRHLDLCQQFGDFKDAVVLEHMLLRAEHGDVARVEERLRVLVEQHHPDTQLILEALTAGFRRIAQLARTQEYLELWLQHAPDDVQALEWRAGVNSHLDKEEEALAEYQHLMDLVPDHDLRRLKLAETLSRLGRCREAAAQFECVLRRQPDNADAIVGLARCRHDAHQLGQAQQLLEALLEKQPDQVAALLERARLGMRRGDLATAEKSLRRAVQLAPQDKEASYLLDVCLQPRDRSQSPPALAGAAPESHSP